MSFKVRYDMLASGRLNAVACSPDFLMFEPHLLTRQLVLFRGRRGHPPKPFSNAGVWGLWVGFG
jgi:hypothetical protein